jgi:biopolymer transport protein ExbB/TolQ
MDTFQGIGARGSATLAVVAPGISEALIATAAGLAAAIPAVIFYNYYINRIKKIKCHENCQKTQSIRKQADGRDQCDTTG